MRSSTLKLLLDQISITYQKKAAKIWFEKGVYKNIIHLYTMSLLVKKDTQKHKIWSLVKEKEVKKCLNRINPVRYTPEYFFFSVLYSFRLLLLGILVCFCSLILQLIPSVAQSFGKVIIHCICKEKRLQLEGCYSIAKLSQRRERPKERGRGRGKRDSWNRKMWAETHQMITATRKPIETKGSIQVRYLQIQIQ